MRFEFVTAGRIIFGPGTSAEAAPSAREMGGKALVVTGRTPERVAFLLSDLEKQGVPFLTFPVTGEPAISTVMAGLKEANNAEADLVIGIGGGSVIDAGKVIAALLTNGGEPLDYLEVIGKGEKLHRPPAPYIAIPTTSGTGAEVTRNGVLTVPEDRIKVSMRSPLMLPRLALVDPRLTLSLPPELTASTGMDALTQLLEAYLSLESNPLTDGICREGLKRAASSLRRAYQDGSDETARENMSLASLFGGLALANARLGAVHGFAGTLGGMYSAAHGLICARLLPEVMEINYRALQNRQPSSPALGRYDEIGRILTGRAEGRGGDGIVWIQNLCRNLKIPDLSRIGLNENDFPAVVEKSKSSSSMRGNPLTLSDEELTEILRRSI